MPNVAGNWRGMQVSALERFRSKLRQQPSGCVYFDSRHDKDGYAMFSVDGKVMRASRFIFPAETGTDLGADDCVCHTCDDPRCVNAGHMWRGTVAENNQDRARKGRSSKHCRRGQGCVFTRANIDHMLARRSTGETLASIAKDYGVTAQTIGRLVSGKRGPLV